MGDFFVSIYRVSIYSIDYNAIAVLHIDRTNLPWPVQLTYFSLCLFTLCVDVIIFGNSTLGRPHSPRIFNLSREWFLVLAVAERRQRLSSW